MPEGDTIHRMAAKLRQHLLGRALRRVYLRERGELRDACGREVRSVEAHGKHLIVTLDGGLGLRVHMGMKGRMHHRPGAATPEGGALPLLLATADDAFAFAHASQVEVFRGRPQQSAALARLGPDLLSETLDLDAVVTRAGAPRNYGREIGDLLLDQRVAAGIGNVFKSEALFLCGQDPFAPVGSLGAEALRALYHKASELMRENLRPGRRVTVELADLDHRPALRPIHWVYARSGEPCLRCATPVAMRRQGDAARSTYFCRSCQRVD